MTASPIISERRRLPLLVGVILIVVVAVGYLGWQRFTQSRSAAPEPSAPVPVIATTVKELLTLMLFGMPLDVIGIIGIILLIGIVKKNGIMLVDFALEGQRERGLSTEEAIHEACRLRFRPIMMTTMCALLGGVPLMLGTGIGSEIRQPLGYAIVGGLLVSQLLTLFTTPVVYIYMDRLGQILGRRHNALSAEFT